MKKRLIRLIASSVLFVIALIIYKIFTLNPYPALALFILSYLIAGYDVIWGAIRGIIHGQLLDEKFLMTIATVGAFGIKEYPEAVAVMLLFQLGELFQDYAVNRSRKSISELMNIRPDYANKVTGDTVEKVDPYDVKVGDIIRILPGEKIPLDGTVIDGSSTLDTSALTGESLPREVKSSDSILSGCVNINGVLNVSVTTEFENSTVNKILDLVENAGSKKSTSEKFITKFATVYTPIVVFLAIALTLIPPFFYLKDGFSWAEYGKNILFWLERSLSFLVVSCPCALVISVPLTYFGGIGGASKAGILIKGSNYLEALAKAETIVWDKTGTLTQGIFSVNQIQPVNLSKEELLFYTAHAEAYSSHPIALSIMNAYGKEIDKTIISDYDVVSGYGLKANVNGTEVYVGNASLMQNFRIEFIPCNEIGTVIYVSVDHKFAGSILISDLSKSDSKNAIRSLKSLGVKKNVMLTGDRDEVGQAVANELGIDEVHTQLLPADKVSRVEKLLNETSKGGKVVFVGDGMNDAPVLARADIGVAMGGLGSDAAIEAADIVIMNDEPSKLAQAIMISRKTHGIAIQNIVFALFVKIAILILVAFGFAGMWLAVFADVGVCVIAILNAMRTLRMKSD